MLYHSSSSSGKIIKLIQRFNLSLTAKRTYSTAVVKTSSWPATCGLLGLAAATGFACWSGNSVTACESSDKKVKLVLTLQDVAYVYKSLPQDPASATHISDRDIIKAAKNYKKIPYESVADVTILPQLASVESSASAFESFFKNEMARFAGYMRTYSRLTRYLGNVCYPIEVTLSFN